MNRNQRATRNNQGNKPFVSGGVMTNFTETPASQPTPLVPPIQKVSFDQNRDFHEIHFFSSMSRISFPT